MQHLKEARVKTILSYQLSQGPNIGHLSAFHFIYASRLLVNQSKFLIHSNEIEKTLEP